MIRINPSPNLEEKMRRQFERTQAWAHGINLFGPTIRIKKIIMHITMKQQDVEERKKLSRAELKFFELYGKLPTAMELSQVEREIMRREPKGKNNE